MIEIEIDLSEVSEMAEKFGRSPEVVDRETLRTMHEAIALVERKVEPYTPVGATGQLRQGIEGIVSPIEGGLEGRVTIVGPAIAYAEPVEFGSRPHWPPPEPIRYWVARVKRVSAEEVPRVAFLVSRKISRLGTPAFKMFQQGWAEAEPKVMSMFNVLAYRIVEGIEAPTYTRALMGWAGALE